MGTYYMMKGREQAAKPWRAEWFDYYARPGKRVKGGSKTFATWQEAEQWAADMEADNAARYGDGTPRQASRTFEEYANEWVRTLTKSRSTIRSYRSNVGQLIGHFGARPVAAITKADVKAYVADMVNRDGRSAGTVKVRLTVLAALMQSAIDDGVRGDDPTRGVDKPRVRDHEARVLTAEEFGKVVQLMPERLRAAAWLAFYTGLRIGEVCGVKSRYLDLMHGNLRVAGVRMNDGTEQNHAKNGTRDQSVGLPVPAVSILRAHIERFEVAPDGYVFGHCRRTGGPVTPLTQSTLRYQWRKAAKAAGLDGAIPRFHDLRHTCATTLAENNTPAYIIQSQLRHGRLDTSQKYIRAVRDEQRLSALNEVYATSYTAPLLAS